LLECSKRDVVTKSVTKVATNHASICYSNILFFTVPAHTNHSVFVLSLLSQ